MFAIFKAMDLLDLFFPKRCVVCRRFGAYFCPTHTLERAEAFCPYCKKSSISGATHAKCLRKLGLDGLIALFRYDEAMKKIIHELKYRFVTDLVKLIGREIRKMLKPEIDFDGYVLAPLPLAKSRKNWRGFNQTELLGWEVARRLNVSVDSNLLVKIKETRPQASLGQKERISEQMGAFIARRKKISENILIFDDVWTTGSTIKAATKALKQSGAKKVWAIVLAAKN